MNNSVYMNRELSWLKFNERNCHFATRGCNSYLFTLLVAN